MMNYSYEYYNQVKNEIVAILRKRQCASISDASIICELIFNIPCYIDAENGFAFKGQIYSDVQDLPDEARNNLLKRIEAFYTNEELEAGKSIINDTTFSVFAQELLEKM